MSNEIRRKQWHPGFTGAIRLEFRDYKDGLECIEEHVLGKAPLRTDMLFLKKDDLPLDNETGEMFGAHNVFEYKCPGDGVELARDDHLSREANDARDVVDAGAAQGDGGALRFERLEHFPGAGMPYPRLKVLTDKISERYARHFVRMAGNLRKRAKGTTRTRSWSLPCPRTRKYSTG